MSVQTLKLRDGTWKEADGKGLAWMQCSHLQSETFGQDHLWSLAQFLENALTAMDVLRKERKEYALRGEAGPPL